ncbi:tRNA (adenosine(37)-N6)-threonylcarbamoyltransferase complex dimerization subunit type 1 TsaB [Poriferisphaera sp. WC338]|uniref:tRNA (adenosine(37)-N6)-threonylcarbamoyltransferase complex dimerization subunit type 1 TsaB n=1 Tax=Poriferisphaera sp. WC338 TaxID=3425129 RepID=UPI003D81A83C
MSTHHVGMLAQEVLPKMGYNFPIMNVIQGNNPQPGGGDNTSNHPDAVINLAIETSSRRGEIALARGDELIETQELPQKKRHNVDLMETVDQLFTKHNLKPNDLSEVYLSSGPGSFTGLRIGIAVAKMLSLAGNVRLVNVPTLQVVAFPPEWRPSYKGDRPDDAWAYEQHGFIEPGTEREKLIGAALNIKKETMYCALYRWGDIRLRESKGRLETVVQPAVRNCEELSEAVMVACGKTGALIPGGTFVGEVLPEDFMKATRGEHRTGIMASIQRLLENKHLQYVIGDDARPRAESLWVLGRDLAKQGRFADPRTLSPAYVREPEAVTLWNQRHGEDDSPKK